MPACGGIVRALRDTRRGAGPLLNAIGSGGYEPPLRNYTKINTVISRYLAGDRRPYVRLTRAYDQGLWPLPLLLARPRARGQL